MESPARRRSFASPRQRRAGTARRARRCGGNHVLHPRRAHEGCSAARPPDPGRAAAAVSRTDPEIALDSLARPPAAEPSRTIRLEPPPRPDIQAEQPTPRGRQAIGDALPITASPKAPPPAPRSSVSVPRPAPAVTPPAAAAGPATPAERAGLKLEALIYSDLPAQRMVFINGRRYAEGDVIDGRLRVEEIQEEGVELSDQGRRF